MNEIITSYKHFIHSVLCQFSMCPLLLLYHQNVKLFSDNTSVKETEEFDVDFKHVC